VLHGSLLQLLLDDGDFLNIDISQCSVVAQLWCGGIFKYEFVAFSALTLLVGWQEGHPACKKLEWWSTGMVICLE